jgi:heme/copper-type cytochrome/quinol oxidase subunit 2
MDWLKKARNPIRSPSGLEWALWRKLPLIALLGTVLPLLVLGALHAWVDPQTSAAQDRMLQLADIVVIAVLIFHWAMVVTVAIGCVIVMVMKGPNYQADSYPISHSDAPRAQQQTRAEAQAQRLGNDSRD